ncbi:uncharacterized protein UMAG_03091 [Mycosarcoma maydis]|uniref:Uncharacterized protein n=1 Tax=Mycosarcoma maydis TaxID=5270 RepID=A0A0D1E3P5_MYCMD|nr:uncharacterized protein UMAG_03091 [Ustilago maydis 521]KIS69115.1 hypothetical protein UMAG_03091 [Ustilago maydis 521]|eukprot:XP_011389450.1 hypothetical protein UMAG_03091 [Ustilago maydis 521]
MKISVLEATRGASKLGVASKFGVAGAPPSNHECQLIKTSSQQTHRCIPDQRTQGRLAGSDNHAQSRIMNVAQRFEQRRLLAQNASFGSLLACLNRRAERAFDDRSAASSLPPIYKPS